MGKSTGQSAPDPYATAAAQTQSNVATAQNQSALNAVNQNNAFGSSTFTRDANGDPTSLTNTLSPGLQGLATGQENLLSGLQGTAGSLTGSLNTNPLTPYQATSFNASNYNTPGANQAFQGEMALLQPQIDRQNTQFASQMANQGIPVGSEAYNSANQQLQANQNSALTSAAGQAQQTGFNQGLQGANFNSGQNQAAFTNQVTGNQVPYSNIATLLSAANPQSLLNMAPSANVPSSSIQPTNVSGDVYQSASMQNQINQQNMSNIMGAGMGLGTLALLSDENAKENRTPASGEASLMKISMLPIDHYRYKDEAQAAYGVPEHRTGPMAQDVKRLFPDSSDGHVVDLAGLAGHMMSALKGLEARTAHLAAKQPPAGAYHTSHQFA